MKAIKEVRSYTLIGDELLVAVLGKFPRGKRLPLKSDIMTAFHRASKNPAYAELFKNYPFDEDGVAPYSKEVADGLFSLSAVQLIDESSKSLWVSIGVEMRFNLHIRSKLQKEQLKLLKELSKEIKQQMLS